MLVTCLKTKTKIKQELTPQKDSFPQSIYKFIRYVVQKLLSTWYVPDLSAGICNLVKQKVLSRITAGVLSVISLTGSYENINEDQLKLGGVGEVAS